MTNQNNTTLDINYIDNPWGDDTEKKPAPSSDTRKPTPDDLEKRLNDAKNQLKLVFSGHKGGGGTPVNPKGNAIVILGFIALAFVLWLTSGVYTVNTKEEAVVLRFGKYVRTTGPGLSYHLPSPIEKIIKISVTERYKTDVGYNPSKYSRSGDTAGLFILTGDENIADVTFEVQWQISDARKFLFNVSDPHSTIKDAAESAMREIIGKTPLNDILSEGRTLAQQRTKELLQHILDSYDIGVTVETINMRGTPPKKEIQVDSTTVNEDGTVTTRPIITTVDESFKDVQAAIINKEEIINTAIARSNELVPQARGQAERLLQEAEGYKQKIIAKAEGEASRFIAVYKEYSKAPAVTRKRIYLETMEEVLGDMDKIIIDDNAGKGVLPYLPLNELKKKQ